MRKLKTLIDHIITNIPIKVIRTDVLATDEISDHDTPYIMTNIKKERFEPRYKFIRDEKNCNLEEIGFFTSSPMVFAFDAPKDKLNILNHLVQTCIERLAPLKRVKLTRPMTPWIKDPVIIEAGNELNHLRKLYLENQIINIGANYIKIIRNFTRRKSKRLKTRS